jgi:RES domain-containing protein
MLLWRISNHADLSGEGGRRVAGRWHERGRLVVYLSEHAALAFLENLVHLEIDPEDLPSKYQILTVEVPDSGIERLVESELDRTAPGWRFDPTITRKLTASWLGELRSLLLRVPSVLVPHSSNYLFNPLHADASKAKIVRADAANYDGRLFRAKPKPTES